MDYGHCERMTNCYWIETDDAAECEMTTTSSTTSEPTTSQEPGCCAGNSYETSLRCINKDDSDTCEEAENCYWIGGEDANCTWVGDMTTTTTLPTQEFGCCAGDSSDTTEQCGEVVNADKCDERKACHWVAGVDADCSWDV